jgi:hypothetical protein
LKTSFVGLKQKKKISLITVRSFVLGLQLRSCFILWMWSAADYVDNRESLAIPNTPWRSTRNSGIHQHLQITWQIHCSPLQTDTVSKRTSLRLNRAQKKWSICLGAIRNIHFFIYLRWKNVQFDAVFIGPETVQLLPSFSSGFKVSWRAMEFILAWCGTHIKGFFAFKFIIKTYLFFVISFCFLILNFISFLRTLISFLSFL